MKPAAVYTWGPSDLAHFVHQLDCYAERGRPVLAAETWIEVDRALDASIGAAMGKVLVVLAADRADDVARTTYVWYEPLLNAVVAIGYADRSVGVTCDDVLCDANAAEIGKLLEKVRAALADGELATALLCVAACIGPAFRRWTLPRSQA